MCELKFRVFDDVNFGTPQIRHFNIFQAHFINHIEKLEIMQYTGLKDKKGKEIYEGDITKKDDGCIGVIEFGLGKFFNSLKLKNGSQWPENISGMRYEVIGNIYETPELLEDVPCE